MKPLDRVLGQLKQLKTAAKHIETYCAGIIAGVLAALFLCSQARSAAKVSEHQALQETNFVQPAVMQRFFQMAEENLDLRRQLEHRQGLSQTSLKEARR